jgi:hypothetical protein
VLGVKPSGVNRFWYTALPKPSDEVAHTIEKDIARTFPEEPYFAEETFGGLDALRTILHKFAVYKSHVGYCQGINFLAGLLLLVSGGNEIESFYALCSLTTKLGLDDMYAEGMPKLQSFLCVFDMVFSRKLPDAYDHFQRENIPDHLWFGKWLLTLGTDSFPLAVAIRIWDSLLIDGPAVLFRVGVAVVRILKQLLLEMEFQ